MFSGVRIGLIEGKPTDAFGTKMWLLPHVMQLPDGGGGKGGIGGGGEGEAVGLQGHQRLEALQADSCSSHSLGNSDSCSETISAAAETVASCDRVATLTLLKKHQHSS